MKLVLSEQDLAEAARMWLQQTKGHGLGRPMFCKYVVKITDRGTEIALEIDIPTDEELLARAEGKRE